MRWTGCVSVCGGKWGAKGDWILTGVFTSSSVRTAQLPGGRLRSHKNPGKPLATGITVLLCGQTPTWCDTSHELEPIAYLQPWSLRRLDFRPAAGLETLSHQPEGHSRSDADSKSFSVLKATPRYEKSIPPSSFILHPDGTDIQTPQHESELLHCPLLTIRTHTRTARSLC